MFGTTTSDVWHWYLIAPSLLLSRKQRFPDNEMENAHRSLDSSSHITPAAKIISKKLIIMQITLITI
jgi:hypothetical protein